MSLGAEGREGEGGCILSNKNKGKQGKLSMPWVGRGLIALH